MLTRRLRFILLKVFKSIHLLNLDCLNDMLKIKDGNYSFRNTGKLLQPKKKTTTFGLRSIAYLGAKLWNDNVCNFSDPQEKSLFCWEMAVTFHIFDTFIKIILAHDDVIKWKPFPRYWPFVRGIHRWPVNSPHKGQWRGGLMFSLICARINDWVRNGEAGDLRRHRAHCCVIVM